MACQRTAGAGSCCIEPVTRFPSAALILGQTPPPGSHLVYAETQGSYVQHLKHHISAWYVLIPACRLAIVLVLAIAAHPEDSLLGSVLQIIVVTTSIQIGYVVGLFAPCFVAGCNIYAAAAIAMSADLISISLAL